MSRAKRPNLFKKPTKQVNLNLLREKYQKSAEEAHRKLNMPGLVERLVCEAKENQKSMTNEQIKRLLVLGIDQELLKGLAAKPQYKTATSINSVLMRVKLLMGMLEEGKAKIPLLRKVIQDGIRAFEGFGETNKVEYLRKRLNMLSNSKLEELPITGENKDYLQRIIEDIEDHYYHMFINLLGEKKVTLFEILESNLAEEVLKQIH